MYNSSELIELLKKKYKIEVHQHDALFTVEDSRKLRGKIGGAHTKNLFLKNKKNNFFLLSCEEADKIDLKKISKSLGNVISPYEIIDQYGLDQIRFFLFITDRILNSFKFFKNFLIKIFSFF